MFTYKYRNTADFGADFEFNYSFITVCETMSTVFVVAKGLEPPTSTL